MLISKMALFFLFFLILDICTYLKHFFFSIKVCMVMSFYIQMIHTDDTKSTLLSVHLILVLRYTGSCDSSSSGPAKATRDTN